MIAVFSALMFHIGKGAYSLYVGRYERESPNDSASADTGNIKHWKLSQSFQTYSLNR